MRKTALAKLTRPAQPGVLARERLFVALDTARHSPLVWISGPAGSGKTTLLASYVESRKAPCVWYQLDAADEDPAVLFETLGSCVPARGARLPNYAPLPANDLAAFARRYFRRLFTRLPQPFILVLDAAGEIFADGFLAAIVFEAAQEMPCGSNLVVLARSEPPEKFVRLRLEHTLAQLGWDDLRLSADETREIATRHRAMRPPEADHLHELCGGWVAGLRLFLERPQTDTRTSPGAAQGRESLFSYIASEVFGALDKDTQNALLHTCYLPEVSERAAYVLTKDPTAWSRIGRLHLRRLLVDLHGDKTPLLRYHTLFREFLMARAQEQLPALQLRALQRDTACLLVSSGRPEDAVSLLTRAGEWPAASRLILEEASRMLTRGHTQTLRAWLAALPSWYVDATPRLLYCLGLAQTTTDPVAAIDTLRRAHDRFDAQHNGLAQALCAAAIIQALYFRFDDYSEMEPWMNKLDALMRDGFAYPSADTELHLSSQLQIALTYVHPTHPRLPALAERLLALITRDLDVNQRVVAAGMLLAYFDWFAPDKARFLVTYVQPLLRSRDLTPFNRIWWSMAEAHHCHCAGEGDQYANLMAQIDALRARHEMRFSEAVLATLHLPLVLSSHATQCKPDELARAFASLDVSRRQEEINLRGYLAEWELSRGDVDAGMVNAQQALKLSRDTGLKVSEMEMLGLLAVGYADSGRSQEALEALQAARAIAGGSEPPKVAFHHLLLEAYARLRGGAASGAHAPMRAAFALAREHGYTKSYQWMPHVLARVCAEALINGIESSTVHDLIRQRRLAPPTDRSCAQWPWPITVRVLGQFEVRVDGRPLRFERKAPKKPLELLKLLVAMGRNAVDQSLIAHELWPDSEGDTAESALRMAVHRLRKLLGHDDAILVGESKLQINRTLCWIDAWAFDDAYRIAENVSTLDDIKTLLQSYSGEAFAGDALQPWMLGARDRWRSTFVRAVGMAGAAYEARCQWQAGLDTYERGILIDPLCEAFHQGVMRCLLRQGKTAEAYSAYRRCRDALSITLNVKPSAQTEALRRQIAQLGAA